MVRMNKDQLVMISVIGEIQSPLAGGSPFYISYEGTPYNEFMTGGIVYNVQVGDSAMGWAGDHIEPCVTIRNPDDSANHALSIMACIGNPARVVSGDAKDAIGVVTGKHGGGEKVLVDFAPADTEKMVIGDKIQIKGYGRGLRFPDHPDVVACNLGVELAETMGLEDGADGKLIVPVAATVPAAFMGSGVGGSSARGDYDIQTADRQALQAAGCDRLRLGDIVAILDHDDRFARGSYHQGHISVGIVVHGDSVLGGHGPGVVVLLSAGKAALAVREDPAANIADQMQIGSRRQS
jgi:hypothetical protein